MFRPDIRCDITTKIFEYEPVWGCQSEPDDYVPKKISEITESLEIEQVKDHILSAFLNRVLENPKVVSVAIETDSVYNKWPDEWGSTRTIKKLTYEKKPINDPKKLSKVKIKLDPYYHIESYKRDGVQLDPKDIIHINLSDIKEIGRDVKLQVSLYERKE